MRTYLTSAVALFVAGTAVLVAVPQTTGPRNPPLVIRSLAGGDLFAFYCATCHGRKGTGDGPVAAALKIAAAGSDAARAPQRWHVSASTRGGVRDQRRRRPL